MFKTSQHRNRWRGAELARAASEFVQIKKQSDNGFDKVKTAT